MSKDLQESSRIWERQKRPALKGCKKDLNLLPLDFDLVRLRLDSDLQKCKKNFMFSATETVGIYNQMETMCHKSTANNHCRFRV